MVGNCRLFSLPTWNSFIDQFVHPVGGEGMGQKKVDGRYRYFSPLRVSLHLRTRKYVVTSK